MSYSEIINELESSSEKEVFERLFYQKASDIIAVENAEQQLQIARNYLASTNNALGHYLLALSRRGVIKECNGKLKITYIKDAACIWKCEQDITTKEIICSTEVTTELDKEKETDNV